MYLRRCYREKDGKRHAYWALVESYRTVRGPRQRVVAWLGAMDKQGRMGVKRCAACAGAEQAELFAVPEEPEWVEVDLQACAWSERGDSAVPGWDGRYCANWNWIGSWTRA